MVSQSPNPPHPFPHRFDAACFETRLRRIGAREPFLFPADDVPEHFKRSSVLLCFWRQDRDLRVLLTKRAATLRGHPGQMSFPGGRLEDGEDWVTGALRETEEEVGIPRNRVEVLGRLDDAWSGAGHLLVPVVGWLDTRPTFTANPAEVEAIHTPSVSALFDPDVFTREEARIGDDLYYNSTLRWDEGSVFGLSTDLLIEAVQWAIGLEEHHGPGRLSSLRSWLHWRTEQESESTADSRPES